MTEIEKAAIEVDAVFDAIIDCQDCSYDGFCHEHKKVFWPKLQALRAMVRKKQGSICLEQRLTNNII